ncbi:hypothetical protein Dda_2233 [Drechslerella dactyloides]|uniref:DDE-1 domain-containing protein n=1 Tax=Drechslerella dactyloides TaxID=74499 RepID=A0AAD6NM48_DREDA|nr:hypothetical protein Dda_2233 [Drechslerella dactyloides]
MALGSVEDMANQLLLARSDDKAVKTKYGIVDNDIYNFDETGFAMGIISTTTVVTGAETRDKAKLAQPGNREWATVIQGIGAEGWAVPPFIVLAGQHHLASWYTATKLPADWVIALSDNGWTTNELALQWLKHFDKFTARRCISDYRLLVLDGHESHHSVTFELYCQEHKIVTICMPPHSSHILQPLDIGCFGPLKQAYSHEVESLVRTYVNHISKLEFLTGFHKTFTAAITPKNIRSSFARAGIEGALEGYCAAVNAVELGIIFEHVKKHLKHTKAAFEEEEASIEEQENFEKEVFLGVIVVAGLALLSKYQDPFDFIFVVVIFLNLWVVYLFPESVCTEMKTSFKIWKALILSLVISNSVVAQVEVPIQLDISTILFAEMASLFLVKEISYAFEELSSFIKVIPR